MSAYELRPDGTLKEVDLKRADLVAVVRCRDCRHMEPRTFNDPITDIDAEWFLCSYFERPTRRDGFCAWGDRRYPTWQR